MSGIFTEQGFIDRLVSRIENRFRWVPAWEKWLEYCRGVWRDWQAEENLQIEYRRCLGDEPTDSRQEKYARANALSASSQKWALWLLSREPRLIARAEEFDREKPLHPPFPGTGETMTLSNLAGVLSHEGNRAELEDWTLRMRACVESAPNLLWRTDTQSPDLGILAPLLTEILGSYVTRLSPETWSRFPYCLTPEVAWQLTGTNVCFLEGLENCAYRRFPQWALQRWVSWGHAEWVGLDRRRYSLRLPRFFILTGPPYGRIIERELAGHVIEVRTHGKGHG